jgi:glucosamine-6-phosphate deaminase
MKVIVRKTAEEMSRAAADIFEEAVRAKPNVVIGLATGGTPEKLYAELARRHREKGLDFSKVVTFNLDEYLGLDTNHDQSYRYFMNDRLFNHINIRMWNTHVLNGTAEDPGIECRAFETAIQAVGGVDLWLLGIGNNGHVAFNEPGSPRLSRTRVVKLSQSTIDANSDGRFFKDPNDVPRFALSAGIGTILEAKRIVLIANGEGKAAAIAAAVEGPQAEDCPASFLQGHPDATIIVDQAAAGKLKKKAAAV